MPNVFCKAADHCENGNLGICTLTDITLGSNGGCEQYRKKELVYPHFGILLFFQNKLNRDYVFDILQKWHGFNIDVDFVDIDFMLGPTADSGIIDKVAQMIVHCQYQECYIIPEQCELRQALKNLIEEKDRSRAETLQAL